jgi:DNA (cytosine-5)-methyltransferase 1
MPMSSFSSIDLFAGCGGLSLGLHRAGWEGRFAIERDPMAFDTLRDNLIGDGSQFLAYAKWPSWLPVAPLDIEKVLADVDMQQQFRTLQGEITLVAGGPPCQGFSVGGSRDAKDARNHLVHRLLQVVELVRPKVVLIENVEGITRAFRARSGEALRPSVADDVVEALDLLGYKGTYGVCDTSRFGVPQVRRRAVIIGVRQDLGLDPQEFFGALEAIRADHLGALKLPLDRLISAREALSDLHNPAGRVPSPDSPGYETSNYGPISGEYIKAMRSGIRTGETPDSHRFSKHGERVSALYKDAHATQAKGRLSKAFLLASGTKKDKKVLIDPTVPVSTITTHPDEFIHYAEPRNITVREMARLQSFPDSFRFRGRYTINGPRRRFDVARCSQVGNAVPPNFAQAVGSALIQMLGGGNGAV